MAVVEADDHHAEVQEIRDDREQRRFLPAMLRCSCCTRPADPLRNIDRRPQVAYGSRAPGNMVTAHPCNGVPTRCLLFCAVDHWPSSVGVLIRRDAPLVTAFQVWGSMKRVPR